MAYFVNPLLKQGLQKKQHIPEPPTVDVDSELSPTSTNPVQNAVITNKIAEITSDSIDIDVSTLADFLVAVERSNEVSVRIHLRDNISLTDNITVNLDNCQIYGHDNRIFLENHTFTIQGEYCYFYQVRFNASSLVNAYTANQSDYNAARIRIISNKLSTRFFFEYVTFMNFICHSFDKQKTIIEVDTASSGSPSLHLYFLYCEVMTNYLGTNLPRINDCVWSVQNIGNSLHCLTAHIIDYWGVGFDGENYDSTKNFNFSGNPLQGFAKLGFTSDASINYAASPSGYTSLTPNAVNIYNASSTEFSELSTYVHGNHFATAAQGTKADTALQSIAKGTDADFVKLTVSTKASNSQTISLAATMQDILTATAQSDGLVAASDAKNLYLAIIDKINQTTLWYGAEWQQDDEIGSPECTRIGNEELHRSLPVQSAMVGGVMTDGGIFTPFDNPDDWTQATQLRDGTDGQVMVKIPKHYIRFEQPDAYKVRCKISQYPLAGFHEIPEVYCSAYEAALQRSTSKLCSVANADPDFRGGDNQSSWDGTYRDLLGRPATVISLTNFRAYARNRNSGDTRWNQYLYHAARSLYWLYVTEYATLNSQKAYNAATDSDGFMQGGLGDGVTTWDGTSWNNWNGYRPFVPCGHTDEYGDHTGVKNYTIYDSGGTALKTFAVPRYRGIENPFGHIWKWADGTLINVTSSASDCYVCDTPSDFSSTSTAAYTKIGSEARAEGYVKKMMINALGDIYPLKVGGASNKYYCDYHFVNVGSNSLRGCLLGGGTSAGAYGGLVYVFTSYVPTDTHTTVGSRLCFSPE